MKQVTKPRPALNLKPYLSIYLIYSSIFYLSIHLFTYLYTHATLILYFPKHTTPPFPSSRIQSEPETAQKAIVRNTPLFRVRDRDPNEVPSTGPYPRTIRFITDEMYPKKV